MKRIKLFLATLMVLTPFAANADFITYQFTGTGSDGIDSYTIEGTFVFDAIDVVAGIDILPDLVSWMFSWSNGVDTLSNSDADSTFVPGSQFFVDAGLSIVSVGFCTRDCNGVSDWPALSVDLFSWAASSLPQATCCVGGSGQWSGPIRVATVPEPGTLTLVGLGLIALGLTRRRKKA